MVTWDEPPVATCNKAVNDGVAHPLLTVKAELNDAQCDLARAANVVNMELPGNDDVQFDPTRNIISIAHYLSNDDNLSEEDARKIMLLFRQFHVLFKIPLAFGGLRF
ncbi:unnamed protein product [Cuscuta europaea]|uniref:Uncharacterized protein n=1 Tax=Cuscuta europaea TaxID=41803 RepID=A0A9P0ZH13_CUSEU|nr:unnamed protein product [Cuscuta europaea]